MSNALLLEVTSKDIWCGHPGDPENCAVALAFQRQFTTDEVRVGYHAVFVSGRKFIPSEAATTFILETDEGYQLFPERLPFYREVNDDPDSAG